METTAKNSPDHSLHLVVLVPHRDCLPLLDEYRRALFAAGLAGAWSFPPVAPIALLGAPLPAGTLKALAAELRRLLGNRKIVSGPAAGCVAPGKTAGGASRGIRLFGPVLDLPWLPCLSRLSLAEETLFPWEKPVLAPAVLDPRERVPDKHIPLALSFRAAALANLVLRPASCGEAGYSFAWETGPLFWLPKP
ncbi:MAG: hypothetical protein LBK77_01350 [Spirochaetaceae bacterium]|jgi:hypothetical protein|nr:hypothetical protein [Spirochaetaceae bacterium]